MENCARFASKQAEDAAPRATTNECEGEMAECEKHGVGGKSRGVGGEREGMEG